MAEPDRPQSPFAGMADFSARTPLRMLSPDEIYRMLAEHRLYLETEHHQGHRANFSSADLSGWDFSGLNLRGIKMDRAVLRGADFSGAHLQSANLVGALTEMIMPKGPVVAQVPVVLLVQSSPTVFHEPNQLGANSVWFGRS